MNARRKNASSTPPPIRVLLADDSELMRNAVKMALVLHRNPPIHVIGETGTLTATVAECARLKPDVLLLDIRLPDGSGLDACRRILQHQPGVRVVMLTGASSDKLVQEAILAGAQGYLTKEIDPASLVQAVVDVVGGRPVFDPEATARAIRLVRAQATPTIAESLALLSRQEQRVLALVAEGKTNKEISAQLGLSANTVKNYLGNAFEKLRVKHRSQAASIYAQGNPPKA